MGCCACAGETRAVPCVLVWICASLSASKYRVSQVVSQCLQHASMSEALIHVPCYSLDVSDFVCMCGREKKRKRVVSQAVLRQPCSFGAQWSMITKVSRAMVKGEQGQMVETLTCGNTEVLGKENSCQFGWKYICMGRRRGIYKEQ